MNYFKGTILGIVLGVSSFGAVVFWKVGYFKKVEISESIVGPYTMLYQEHIGAYHKVSAKILEVENWVKNNGLKCKKSFGLYLDHPDLVPEDKLRSEVGCLFKPAMGLGDTLKKSPFKTKNYKGKLRLQATFTGSPALTPIKVYPKLYKDWIQYPNQRDNPKEHLPEILEIYHSPDGEALSKISVIVEL